MSSYGISWKTRTESRTSLRESRLNGPGKLQHVIIRVIERRHIVDDDKDRENFVSRLGLLAAESEIVIFARTPMTNHTHLPVIDAGPVII